MNRQVKPLVKERKRAEAFHRYGWICLFALLCFTVYSQAMEKKSELCFELKSKIASLESLKESLKQEKEHLTLQIQSQEDPDWIEMVLKEKLGVVSEGQMKVYFKRDE